MQFLFILSAMGSLAFGFLGLRNVQDSNPSAEPMMGSLQVSIGLVGVLMSAAAYLLCGYMQRTQKQLDELSRTVRYLQKQDDEAHKARMLPRQ